MSTTPPIPVVVDVETTGFGSQDRIVEIAAITLDPRQEDQIPSTKGTISG